MASHGNPGVSFHDVVAEVARGLFLERSPDSVLEELLRGAGQVLAADAQSFLELDVVRGGMRCRASSGLAPESVEALGRYYAQPNCLDDPLVQAILGEVQEGRPVLVQDGEAGASFHPAVLAAGFRKILCAPVMLGEIPQGVLTFYYRSPGVSVSLDQAMSFAAVTSLALRHAAVAIENARLVQGLERSQEELRRLADSLEDRVRVRSCELDSAQQELLRCERMASLGRLAATVAHEVRNPLAVIRNSAYYLKSRLKAEDEKVARHLGMIDSQVRLAGKIVSDLLDFSRDSVPEKSPVEINRVVREVLDRVKGSGGVEVLADLSEDLPFICADEVHIEQVVRNLVHNALQAMPGGGTLTVRTRLADGTVRIEVADTGVGIREEDRERIFDPLYTTRSDGSGLGLTLVRKLVRGHGGQLELESAPGEGATFRITFPLR